MLSLLFWKPFSIRNLKRPVKSGSARLPNFRLKLGNRRNSRAFAAGDSCKDTKSGNENEGTGRRKLLYLYAKNSPRAGGGGRGIRVSGVVFRDIHCYESNRNSQVDTKDPIDQI